MIQPFTTQVITILQQIPKGKVMTYGQVASLAGSSRAARQVVRILHSSSEKYQLPWHRVVNAQGEVAIQNDTLRQLQIHLLALEGIPVSPDGRVDLTTYRYVD